MKWKYRPAKRRRRHWPAAVILLGMTGTLWFFSWLRPGRWNLPVQETAASPVEGNDNIAGNANPYEGGMIPVPLMSQESLDMPTGCELVSAYMLLEYYGYSMSFNEWVAECVPMQEFWYEDGQLGNLSSWGAFIGMPFTEWEKALVEQRYAELGMQAVAVSAG